MADQNVIDKSLRSVFVGNIPYDVTEEKLKDIFSEVGPVVSFKIVYDRETGKPKGYGFCEYRDQETAMSAMRNLNNYEISGRTLRVDNACTEKSRLEMQNLMQEKTQESQYGDITDPTQTPEVISKAVASLPPEQMFELMKQMKLSVQNNPNETRTMLLQNPQLAYALLQALVVMRVIDPSTAVTMLQKGHGQPPNLHAGGPDGPGGFGVHPGSGGPGGPPMGFGQPRPAFVPPVQNDPWQHPSMTGPPSMPPRGGLLGDRPFAGQDVDLRQAPGRGDHDLRVLANQPQMGPNIPPSNIVPPVRGAQPMGDIDRRDPRTAASAAPPSAPRDPRAGMGRPGPAPAPQPQPAPQPVPPVAASAAGPPGRGIQSQLAGSTDQEKAALIMQVLQLSDEQIALLPLDQRQSIMVLKEQIARSSQPR